MNTYLKTLVHVGIVAVFSAAMLSAAVNVPLTIQEALYPGSMAGLARSGDPVTIGVPLPDDPNNGATDTSQLTLSGATAGQFRILGRWPSGRIKWVLVDTVADVTAGGVNTSIALTAGGAGNFGGANLATDNGSTITVSTGAATFTIRKANFNVIDQVQISGKTIVASGSSQGLVVAGPAPGQTVCPPCTTLYSSVNDASSTAVIEENGPVKTVIKATGTHVDGAGNAYMHFTARLYFYKGKTAVKVTSILRNADYGTSNTAPTAYKGHQGYELRITPSLGSGVQYSVANHTATPSTGTLAGTDSVYIYQADSQLMKHPDWCGYGCVPYTKDSGYTINKNGAVVTSGDNTQFPQGWADVSDSTGAGMEIGVYQMAAYSPKSLEFNSGGTDVRIGIWARQNSQPYYQAWPAWSIHDLYLNFHASAPASPSNEFLKFQHYLVGRASRTQYNAAGVFLYNVIDPTQEDNYYKSVADTATPALTESFTCCLQDRGITDTYRNPLYAYRFYGWGDGGGGNQMEFHLSFLLNFISRGYTGRYLDASHFYRFVAEKAFPHSDGFNWRDRPNSELDAYGFPIATAANSTLSFVNYVDQEHAHWYGMPDYYFMSGDETIKEALLEGPKDRYLNPNVSLNIGYLWNSRAVGGELMSTARFGTFLSAIGDPDSTAALNQGINTYNLQIKPEMCMSGYPVGCTVGTVDNPVPGTTGVSRTRGAAYGWKSGGAYCSAPAAGVRLTAAFQTSILLEGIWELRQIAGPSWADYDNSLDLAYGISKFALTEMYVDDGTGNFVNNGFRYYESLDSSNTCDTTNFTPRANQTVWFPFLIQHAYNGTTEWKQKFNMALQKTAGATATDEFGHFTIATVIDAVNNPGNTSVVNVPVTAVNNGGGSYTLQWTVPSNAVGYKIKTGPKQIVDWIGFDPAANQFTGDPSTTMAWFAATTVPSPPTPAAAGSTQTVTLTGYPSSGQFFALKATVTGTGSTASSAPSVSISAPTTGSTVSGTVSVTASVTATAGVSTVNVSLDSAALGSATPGSAGSYSFSWNTALSSNGAHVLSISAVDTAGNTGTATVSVSISNGVPAPVVSGVAASSIGSTSAAISWTTDKSSDSQVAYGTTTAYGSLSTLSSAMVTSHSVTLSGLTASTAYHYKVMSHDSSGNVGSSGDMTFTTTANSPAVNTTITAGNWTMIQTHGIPAQSVGWEKLVYSPAMKGFIMFGNYHELSSEPNRGMNIYTFDTNRWDNLDVGDSMHTEGMPEAGHPTGIFVYDSNVNAVLYYCCASGSNQPENVNHTWWYDPVGQVGRDKFTSPKPGIPMEATGAFDPVNNKFIFHGSSYGTWSYDPVANLWTQLSPAHVVESGGGTFPVAFDGIAMASMTYNSSDKKLYLFGGRYGYGPGETFSNDLFTYDVVSNTWTMLNPAGGVKPPARQEAAFAYDSQNNVLLTFGGHDNSGLPTPPAPLNDTWIFDVTAHAWTQVNPAQSPTPVGGTFEGMAYDPDHNIFVLALAGPGGYADGNWTSYPMQTWMFRYKGTGPNPGSLTATATPTSGGINRNPDGWAKTPVLASSGSTLYAGWIENGRPFDTTSATWSHVQVGQQSGSAFTLLGGSATALNSEYSGFSEAFSPSLVYSGGLLWASYYQSNNAAELQKIYAKYWNGTAWTGAPIGTIGSAVFQGTSQLADVGGVPHLAFLEVDKTVLPQNTNFYVKYWNGSQWVQKGTGPLNHTTSATTASSLALASDGTNPYVAWTEYTTASAAYLSQSNPQVYVSRWNGTQWVAVGGSLNSDPTGGWASDASIAIVGGQPYVAWTERSKSGNAMLYVKMFNGTSWVLAGSGPLNKNTSTGWAFHPALTTDGTTLYLGWVEQLALGQKAQTYVSKYSAGAWTALGDTLNANSTLGSSHRVSLAIVGGQVAAAWGEVNFGTERQIFVKQWNGTAWTGSAATTTTPASACDLNSDGKVDATDVQIAINQALSIVACTTADLMQTGQCNVVDVQRVIVASLGGTCRIGP